MTGSISQRDGDLTCRKCGSPPPIRTSLKVYQCKKCNAVVCERCVTDAKVNTDGFLRTAFDMTLSELGGRHADGFSHCPVCKGSQNGLFNDFYVDA